MLYQTLADYCKSIEIEISLTLDYFVVDESSNCLVFHKVDFKGSELLFRRPDNYEPPKGHVEKVVYFFYFFENPAVVAYFDTV